MRLTPAQRAFPRNLCFCWREGPTRDHMRSSRLLLLRLALCSLPGAHSLAAAQWLKAGRAGPLVTGAADEPATAGHWKLGLLPFPRGPMWRARPI